MKNWDLQDRKIPPPLATPGVICDPGRATRLLTLVHSGLKGSATAEIGIVSYVEAAPWLRAMLRVPTGDETLSAARLGKEGSLELVLVCDRPPLPEEKAAAEDDDFRMVIPVTAVEPGGRRVTVQFEIIGLRLQTLEQAVPEVVAEYPEIAELGRRAALEGGEVALCRIAVAMPAGSLEYAGQPAAIEAFATVTPSVAGKGETTAYLRLGEISWPAGARRADELGAGGSIEYSCTVPAAELLEAAGREEWLGLRIDWSVNIRLMGGETAKVEESRTLDIRILQDEILALRSGGVLAVPKMRAGAPASSTPIDLQFSIPEPADAPSVAGRRELDFEVLVLDRSWERIEAHVRVVPASFSVTPEWLEQEEPLAPQAVVEDTIRFRAPLDRLTAGLEEQDAKGLLQLLFVLVARRDGEAAIGAVSAPVTVREREARYLACVDFGASAIAAWFGEFRRDSDRQLMPLGEFVHSVAGRHAEYDPNTPGRNVLAPSMVGLSPEAHLRSRRDPLSLGDLALAGAGREAVGRRLAALGRTYDISLPADPETQAGAVIPDLKRRLLNSKSRLATPVPERRGEDVQATAQLDLRAVTRDVFSELGSYVAPNALRHGDLGNAQTAEDLTPHEHWLDCDAGDIQVVVTHPSGVSVEKREIYAEAGRAFAQEFAAFGRPSAAKEPKLIPEALAAAYFGITRTRKTTAGPEVFACIDIGASTVDASLVRVQRDRPGAIESWEVLAHFGATVGGANLDEALLALCLKSLRRLFPKAGSVHGDLTLNARHQDDASIRRALAAEIQRAKRRLSRALFDQAGSRGSYRWAQAGPGEAFRVRLKDILAGREPGQPLQSRADPVEGMEGAVKLRVEPAEGGGQDVWLVIQPSLLDGYRPIASPNREDPAAVARLLGRAVPAMLIREAERLGASAPEWVVTGRASLWPPIYEGISRTVTALGRGKSLAPQPFAAEDMKNAIVHGARSLAITGLELTDGASHPYALVLYDEGDEAIGQIDYLGTEGRPEGSRKVAYRANCWLSRVLPGLGDPGTPETITRAEIARLFAAFGQKVTVDECLVRRVGLTGGGPQEVEIGWEQRGQDIVFRVGDIVVQVRPNRLAGS